MTGMLTRSLTAVAVAAVALGGGLASASAASAAPAAAPAAVTAKPKAPKAKKTLMHECVHGVVTHRPRRYTVACGDGNQYLDKLTWKKWGTSAATATGVMRVRDCSKSCAKGKLLTFPVTVRVDRLEKGAKAQYYTRMKVTYTKKVPAGDKRVETIKLIGAKR